jgi:hypothetical protein
MLIDSNPHILGNEDCVPKKKSGIKDNNASNKVENHCRKAVLFKVAGALLPSPKPALGLRISWSVTNEVETVVGFSLGIPGCDSSP